MKLQKKDANGSKTYNVEECLEKISGINDTVDDINAKLEKISHIEAKAEVNQNAFSKVAVGSTTIEADNKTDKLIIEAGDNITLTPDTTNDKITIAAKVDMSALDGKLDKTGGTLTGNLTGKYITGTWLQTTEATDLGSTPGKIAVLDNSGWVYYRTPAEMLADLGADYIAEQGSTTYWYYRKWNNGWADCWRTMSISGYSCNTAVGNWYRTSIITPANYPFTFTESPKLNMFFETDTGTGGIVWPAGTSSDGDPKTKPHKFYIIRMTPSDSISGKIHFQVKGKWK